ncbi:MAG: aspartate carbamoyltransferase regulatory subunit [Muribaculaceae bacterium]|nr:aspartate carbamoyltransferase regulatory subunit [Muribaculaceae bacterium]
MKLNNKKELAVAALENGTVIDHIPSKSVFKVVNLLGLKDLNVSVTIGYNLDSRRMGTKGIIKVADMTFPEHVLNRIAVIAPNAVINIIRDYAVVDKHPVTLPDELIDIVQCNNPQCITNNEPMRTRFHVVDRDNTVLRCHFCEHTVSHDEITLK